MLDSHSQVQVDNYPFEVSSARGHIQGALGLNASFANHRLGVEISLSHGKNLKQPVAVQALYRYQW